MALTAAALSALAAGSRLYLDTNLWIYALEGFAPFAEPLAQLFARVDAGELVAVTSELTLAEALVKPMQSGREDLQRIYLDTLQSRAALVLAPISRLVLIEAARLRAQHAALKLPDAIHAATAVAHDARLFLTSDARFASVAGINTVVLTAD